MYHPNIFFNLGQCRSQIYFADKKQSIFFQIGEIQCKLPPGKRLDLLSDPLNSYTLNSQFSLNSSGNLKTLKALSLMPMLNYPLNSSPHLVHYKISAYFSDELSGSKCTLWSTKKHPSVSLAKLVLWFRHRIRHFSKLAEFTAHCQIANDWSCFVEHKLYHPSDSLSKVVL